MPRRSKKVVETYKKFKAPAFTTLKALPTQSAINRMHSERTHKYKSVSSVGPAHTERNSIMDEASLLRESPEVREAIIAKSKQIAPAYNKGAVQYVTENTDLRTLGRKV